MLHSLQLEAVHPCNKHFFFLSTQTHTHLFVLNKAKKKTLQITISNMSQKLKRETATIKKNT